MKQRENTKDTLNHCQPNQKSNLKPYQKPIIKNAHEIKSKTQLGIGPGVDGILFDFAS